MQKLIPAALGLMVVSALAATSINHYQSATASGVYSIAAAPGAAKAKKAVASGKCNPAAGSGTINLRWGEIPEGIAVSVSITGPQRWRRDNLTPGRNYIYQRVRTGKYTVIVNGRAPRKLEAPAGDETVGKAFSIGVTGDNCVKKNGSVTLTVGYALEPGSERLWLSANGGEHQALVAFNNSRIASDGSPLPEKQYAKINGWRSFGNTAIDQSGNLWVLSFNDLARYAMKDLGKPSAKPDITVTVSEQGGADLAFDASGALWVANGKNKVYKLNASQLTTSGNKTPNVVLSGVKAQALAFDHEGNLWVAIDDNVGEQPNLGFYSRERLNASSSNPPDRTITLMKRDQDRRFLGDPTYNGFHGTKTLAFDRGGNLWIGFWNSAIILSLNPSELEQEGQVTTTAGWVNFPGTCCFILNDTAFDEAGNLWLAGSYGARPNPANGTLYVASPDQLSRGVYIHQHGAGPIPEDYEKAARVITPNITEPWRINPDIIQKGGADALVMNPSPTWSPINDKPRP